MILCFYLAFCSCKVPAPALDVNKFLTYRSFNLLTLEGTDTLKQLRGANYVKVGYKAGCFPPVYIRFHRKGPDVTYLLKDSFNIDTGKTIYTYFTKNFFGEKPGKHKYYRGHYFKNEYLVYINSKNEIVVVTNDLLSWDPNFNSIDLYLLNKDGSIRWCMGHTDKSEDAELTKPEKYLKWKKHFKEKGNQHCFETEGFPGLIKTN